MSTKIKLQNTLHGILPPDVFRPYNTEVIVAEIPEDTNLYDIIHGYDLSKITGRPVKQIKIGNGTQTFNELKSIIILDNADFIIIDKNGYIIDYITNGFSIAGIATID